MLNISGIKFSYKRVLCGSVFITSFLIYTPIVYTLLNSVETNTISEFKYYKNQTDTSASKILSVALSANDTELINTTLDSLVDYHFIYSLTIRDNFNEVIAYSINDDFDILEVDMLRVKELPIYSNDVFDDEKIKLGMLVVSAKSVLSSNTYLTPFTKALLVTVIFSFITSLLFMFFNKNIKQNISNMVSSAKQLASGEKGIRLSEDTKIQEIFEFSKAFNTISVEREKVWHEIEYQEQVFELKKSILQIAAHELRSPIGGIKTLLDIAIHHSKENRNEDVLLTLKKSYSEIDSLNKHITAILCLSALENNTLTRSDDWVDVQKLFHDLDKQFSVKCYSKQNIVWDCSSIGDCNKYVYIDYDLVTIIISNAIDNAIKYTSKGYVNTTFEVTDDNLVVVVHDSGVGLSEDEIDILHNSPNQLQNSIKRKKDGWGIGLATMYRFADFLDGSIDFDSMKDFGTKVTITIPVKNRVKDSNTETDHAETDNPIDKISTITNNDAFSTSYVHNVTKDGFKVIVIDNNSKHLDQMDELLSPRFLRRDDVEVTFCSVSSDAIRHIEETHFDLLLIDYHMPGMDGLQFLRFINENDTKCKNAAKYIVTADANIPELAKNEMLLYCNKILSKGLTSNDVRSLISGAFLKAVS